MARGGLAPLRVMSRTLLAQTSGGNTALEGLGFAGNQAGYTDAPSVVDLTANLINALLAVSGIILVCFIVYGGFVYMTAGGDTDKIKSAKRIIVNAIIGIVIMVSAYAISSFVLQQLTGAVSNQTPTAALTETRETAIL